jgi:hypothetical protein
VEHFEYLGSVVQRLHGEFRSLYFVLLPIFFCLALVMAWFRGEGSAFIDLVRRAFVATILLIAFREATDGISLISKGLAERISDMSGLEGFIRMAGEKVDSYAKADTSLLIGVNDLMVSILSFVSYVFLYGARYVTVALYHFSWTFLSLLAPFLLLFHLFSSSMTANLFRSLVEIASWRIVWAVLSAILTALPFGDAYRVEGGYITIALINFIVAICMLGTPWVVHALVGSGFASVSGTIGAGSVAAIMSIPKRGAAVAHAGRDAIVGARQLVDRPHSAVRRSAPFTSRGREIDKGHR